MALIPLGWEPLQHFADYDDFDIPHGLVTIYTGRGRIIEAHAQYLDAHFPRLRQGFERYGHISVDVLAHQVQGVLRHPKIPVPIVARALDDLFGLARRHRVMIEGLARLFGRFHARLNQDLGHPRYEAGLHRSRHDFLIFATFARITQSGTLVAVLLQFFNLRRHDIVNRERGTFLNHWAIGFHEMRHLIPQAEFHRHLRLLWGRRERMIWAYQNYRRRDPRLDEIFTILLVDQDRVYDHNLDYERGRMRNVPRLLPYGPRAKTVPPHMHLMPMPQQPHRHGGYLAAPRMMAPPLPSPALSMDMAVRGYMPDVNIELDGVNYRQELLERRVEDLENNWKML